MYAYICIIYIIKILYIYLVFSEIEIDCANSASGSPSYTCDLQIETVIEILTKRFFSVVL